MTLDELVEATFNREGRVYALVDQPTGPGGVTLPALSVYRGHPCTVEDLKNLSLIEAAALIKARFQRDLVLYHFDQIVYEPLRTLLLDTEYNSGEGHAVRWLQALLGVDQDGALGPKTLNIINSQPSWSLLTNAYVALRAHKALTGDPRYTNGLLRRAISFTVLPREVVE